jgi:phage shock protein PspC (stress-responsive transcriptional regulator)
MSASSPRPPLRRPRSGRVLAGVAAGLATHLGLDVTVVRILVVVVTLLTSGLGVLAYLAAILLIPETEEPATATAPATPSPVATASSDRDPTFWIGLALLVLGGFMVLPLVTSGWGSRIGPGLIWPLVLIGFGLALWRAGDRRSAVATAASSPPAPASPALTSEITTVSTDPRSLPPRAPGTGAEPSLPSDGPANGAATPPPPVWSPPPAGGTRPPYGDGTAPAWTPPPAPERSSSLLGRITVGLALVTAGVLWLLDLAGVAPIGLGRIVSAALLVLGLGLVVGGVVGRARWLILPAALLVPLVLVASVATPFVWNDLDVRSAGFGDRNERPTSIDDLGEGYELGAGDLVIDLTGIDLDEFVAAGTTRVEVRVGAGAVSIRVPADVDVRVTAQVGAGEVRLFGMRTSGVGVERTEQSGPATAEASIDLDVQVGLGQVTVDGFEVDRDAVSGVPDPDATEQADDADEADGGVTDEDGGVVGESTATDDQTDTDGTDTDGTDTDGTDTDTDGAAPTDTDGAADAQTD